MVKVMDSIFIFRIRATSAKLFTFAISLIMTLPYVKLIYFVEKMDQGIHRAITFSFFNRLLKNISQLTQDFKTQTNPSSSFSRSRWNLILRLQIGTGVSLQNAQNSLFCLHSAFCCYILKYSVFNHPSSLSVCLSLCLCLSLFLLWAHVLKHSQHSRLCVFDG